MDFKTYQRKPFVVEAVEITLLNIQECADLIGELAHTEAGDPFIRINRRLVPNMNRAYVGWWITRMDDNLRCYSPKIFESQFELMQADQGPVVTFNVSHVAA